MERLWTPDDLGPSLAARPQAARRFEMLIKSMARVWRPGPRHFLGSCFHNKDTCLAAPTLMSRVSYIYIYIYRAYPAAYLVACVFEHLYIYIQAGRDTKLTEGLFRSTKAVSTSPVANLLLGHLMHGPLQYISYYIYGTYPRAYALFNNLFKFRAAGGTNSRGPVEPMLLLAMASCSDDWRIPCAYPRTIIRTCSP